MSALDDKFWCTDCGHKLGLHVTGKCSGVQEDNDLCSCNNASELSALRAEIITNTSGWMERAMKAEAENAKFLQANIEVTALNVNLQEENSKLRELLTELEHELTLECCYCPECGFELEEGRNLHGDDCPLNAYLKEEKKKLHIRFYTRS